MLNTAVWISSLFPVALAILVKIMIRAVIKSCMIFLCERENICYASWSSDPALLR